MEVNNVIDIKRIIAPDPVVSTASLSSLTGSVDDPFLAGMDTGGSQGSPSTLDPSTLNYFSLERTNSGLSQTDQYPIVLQLDAQQRQQLQNEYQQIQQNSTILRSSGFFPYVPGDNYNPSSSQASCAPSSTAPPQPMEVPNTYTNEDHSVKREPLTPPPPLLPVGPQEQPEERTPPLRPRTPPRTPPLGRRAGARCIICNVFLLTSCSSNISAICTPRSSGSCCKHQSNIRCELGRNPQLKDSTPTTK